MSPHNNNNNPIQQTSPTSQAAQQNPVNNTSNPPNIPGDAHPFVALLFGFAGIFPNTWKHLERNFKVYIPLVLLIYGFLVYACNTNLRSAHRSYSYVCDLCLYKNQEWSDLEKIKKSHSSFFEEVNEWENASQDESDRIVLHELRNSFEGHVILYKSLEYEAYKDYMEAWLYLMGNSAIVHTISAILYNKPSYAEDAEKYFEDTIKMLEKPSSPLDNEWLRNSKIVLKIKVFRIHLAAFIAVRSKEGSDRREKHLNIIKELSDEQGGLKSMVENATIKNGETISNLNKLEL